MFRSSLATIAIACAVCQAAEPPASARNPRLRPGLAREAECAERVLREARHLSRKEPDPLGGRALGFEAGIPLQSVEPGETSLHVAEIFVKAKGTPRWHSAGTMAAEADVGRVEANFLWQKEWFSHPAALQCHGEGQT